MIKGEWADSVIRSDLPDPNNEPSLFELIKTYQIHRHSKICRKYRNEKCRFCFGKFFTSNHNYIRNSRFCYSLN